MSGLIELDGSLLEGGGQILRVALTLSCLNQVPVRIFNIRAGRFNPGLREQHLTGVQLVRDICRAKVTGAHLGSTEISFYPGKIRGSFYKSYIKTAGSISLLLQVALPVVLFAYSNTTLELHGGTNTEMAPQIDYTTEVFRPILEKFGATFDFDLVKRGYFPKGGGKVYVKVSAGQELKGINLTEMGNVKSIIGWSFVAGTMREHLAARMADSARSVLKQYKNINIECYKEDQSVAPDNAAGIILVAETDTGCILGGSALSKRREDFEETGARAAAGLVSSLNQRACVDEYSQDQIVILMAIAKGPSSVRVGKITLHTRTAISVIELIAKVQFNVVPTTDGGNIIHCSGS